VRCWHRATLSTAMGCEGLVRGVVRAYYPTQVYFMFVRTGSLTVKGVGSRARRPTCKEVISRGDDFLVRLPRGNALEIFTERIRKAWNLQCA
jgi:hypothetical protein